MKSLQILIPVVILGAFAFISNAFAWTSAPLNPPSGNVSAPLNEGSTAQSKIGGLLLNTGGAVNGLIVQFGKVGIGTTSPNQLLSVAGIIESAIGGFKFPDGTVQATAAPVGGGGGDPSSPATAPTISTFTATPSTVIEGQNLTLNGSASKGSSCITQHRMYVVGSQGGVWTPLGCVSTASLSGPLGTAQNSRAFYGGPVPGPGTYTLRWEVQDSSSQITTREATVTVQPSSLGAPTIDSFTVSPSSVTEGQSVTLSGSATQGSTCITQHRMYVVGSQGGVWTPLGCVSTASLSGPLGTAQTSRAFYSNPGTYTLRWEVQDSSSQITTREATLTITTGSSANSGGGNTMTIYGYSRYIDDVDQVNPCPSGWSDTGASTIGGFIGAYAPAARTCYRVDGFHPTMNIYGYSRYIDDVDQVNPCPSGWSDTGARMIGGFTGAYAPAARTCYK